MVRFGHAAYLGIGGYVVGSGTFHALEDGIDWLALGWLQFPAAMLAAALVALVIGAICLRTREIGEDPDKLPRLYAQLINQSIAGRPKDMTVCIHICRGNFQSAWVAEGGYEPVAEALFGEMAVDGYFLEYDDERAGDFRPLRFVPKGKQVVLGLVSSKVAALEPKDTLKRRIDEAAQFMALDDLSLSPQCGFSSTVEGNRVTEADQIAKLKLVIETAREVWG